MPASVQSRRFATTAQVAEATCRSPRTIERKARAGDYRGARKLGKKWLIPWGAVEKEVLTTRVGGF